MTDYSTLFDTAPDAARLAQAFDGLEADITFIDEADVVIYFSPFRIFERPSSCLNKSVYDCHPEEVYEAVEALLDGFRAGEKDTLTFESVKKDDRRVRVCYHAIRDRSGRYLGCMEVATYRD